MIITQYKRKQGRDVPVYLLFDSSTAAAAVKDKEKKNDNYDPKEGIVIKEVT